VSFPQRRRRVGDCSVNASARAVSAAVALGGRQQQAKHHVFKFK
jgi:hypothetical protein